MSCLLADTFGVPLEDDGKITLPSGVHLGKEQSMEEIKTETMNDIAKLQILQVTNPTIAVILLGLFEFMLIY